MKDRLFSALKGQKADYIEVRLDESKSSRLVYRGERLEEAGRTASTGGCVRALVRGGWGFVSFNSLDRLAENVSLAVNQAQLVSSAYLHLNPPAVFCLPEHAEQKLPVDTNPHDLAASPIELNLSAKKNILDEYNRIILGTKDIQTTSIGYADTKKKVTLATSEGTYIEQGRIDLNLRLSAIASKDGDVQQVGLSIGSKGDFATVENLHEKVHDIARRAVALLYAPNVKGGTYTVVLDPVLAGVFVHEAFGHLSEADHIYENPQMRQLMVLGRSFGGKHLNIVDGAAVPGYRGSFKYDDEGTPATKTYLIKEGVLTSRLHSRETAAKMGETPTGNARAINYTHPPIVRMTNTFIEPGSNGFEEMIGGIDEGVYAKDWYGGTTSLEMFTFSAGEAYMIRDGKITEMIRPVVLTGNVFTTLGNIDAIGNDLDMNQGGGCGKAGQSPLPVSNGSPHIRIRNCLVGGK
ncbi:MAG: TldD/PmbA family protein [Chloroflexi bacterium]|nr:TldD/PmbA family protein [Chloroflexota bacterium]